MQKYGFFGGSFNPVTKAHIEIAKKSIQEIGLDKVIFVPVGNKYPKQNLVAEEHRYHMLELTIQIEPKLEVSNLELGKDKAFTTIEVFQEIEKQYPHVEAYFIMGADNLERLPTWKQAEQLVEKYQYIIIERDGYLSKNCIQTQSLLTSFQSHFHVIQNQEHSSISATQIRKAIRRKKQPKIGRNIKRRGISIYSKIPLISNKKQTFYII